MNRRSIPAVFVLFLCSLAWAPPRLATAAESPAVVRVPARAATPNAFSPAVACTLSLLAPGDRLRAPGLTMFANPLTPPSQAGDFAFLPFGEDDFSFDQVNVFYHAQRFLERLQRYGLDPLQYPIYLSVLQAIGSATHPTEPVTFIGTGVEGKNADAKDSDIIVHEITHAVFNPRMPTEQYPLDRGETQPLAEGLADYFAAAVNGDMRMGEYSSPPGGYHDIASDPTVYNYQRWDQLPADPYSRGRVMNGALLEIRAQLGEVADELTFAAVETGPLRCMTCFADAVRWADALRYAGAHSAVIDSAFAHRGIGTGPLSHLAVLGPTWGWSNEAVRFDVRHRCGPGPYSVQWAFRSASGQARFLPGSADSIRIVLPESGVLEATLTDRLGGMYFVSSQPVTVLPGEDPAYRVTGIEILGPRGMDPGEVGSYTYRLTGGAGVAPYGLKWSLQNGVLIQGPDTGPAIRARSRGGDLLVELAYTDAIGQTATRTLRVVTARSMGLTLSGPEALGGGQVGRFTASVSGGLPPYVLTWRQTSSERDDTLAVGNVATSMLSAVDYTIMLDVYDGLGNALSRQQRVRILPTVPVETRHVPRVFRALGSRVPRGGRLVLELPEGSGGGMVELLDLAGRVRVRERLPSEAPATHEMRLPDAVDAGVYFARLVTRHDTRVIRFVVLTR